MITKRGLRGRELQMHPVMHQGLRSARQRTRERVET